MAKKEHDVVKLDHPQLPKALAAWGRWYSARLDRIRAGSSEGYTGYEQDLFEAIGCVGVAESEGS